MIFLTFDAAPVLFLLTIAFVNFALARRAPLRFSLLAAVDALGAFREDAFVVDGSTLLGGLLPLALEDRRVLPPTGAVALLPTVDECFSLSDGVRVLVFTLSCAISLAADGEEELRVLCSASDVGLFRCCGRPRCPNNETGAIVGLREGESAALLELAPLLRVASFDGRGELNEPTF